MFYQLRIHVQKDMDMHNLYLKKKTKKKTKCIKKYVNSDIICLCCFSSHRFTDVDTLKSSIQTTIVSIHVVITVNQYWFNIIL